MPRKPEAAHPDDRRQQFNINASFETRERLRAASEKAGRSIAKEVEFRLENSFARDEVIQLLLGGGDNGLLIQQIVAIIRDEGDWRKDPEAEQSAIDKVVKVMKDDAQASRSRRENTG
jgi:hypothetical protein